MVGDQSNCKQTQTLVILALVPIFGCPLEIAENNAITGEE
jgi:hypothetical protein